MSSNIVSISHCEIDGGLERTYDGNGFRSLKDEFAVLGRVDLMIAEQSAVSTRDTGNMVTLIVAL